MLWCQTVISSVQGRTISTIARMSRLFGISKTDWTHSSSLPDSENPRDRTAEHMENRNKWARRNKDRERERERGIEQRRRHGSQVLPVLTTHPLQKQVWRGLGCWDQEQETTSTGRCWGLQQEPQGHIWQATCNTKHR